MSVTQFQLTKQGGPFETVSVPKPAPSDNEVSIRTKAIGLNPLDWKQRDLGSNIQSWPTVLGVDAAGIVESVGSAVKDFKPGDEVYAVVGHTLRAGAQQEIITVPAAARVAHKPAGLTLEQASTLAVCYLTAAAAITVGLKVPLPHLDPEGTSSLKSVLVVGGSSAVGAHAIQLLRFALPNALILATSSAAHHAHLRALGANKVFDRSAQDNVSVIKAATPDGAGVDAILDAVSAVSGQTSIFDALSQTGPRLFAYPMAVGPVKFPEGINGSVIFGRETFGTKGGHNALPALTELIDSGKYQLPLPVEQAGVGLESIPAALDKLKAGVSGVKLAITI